MAEIVNGAPVVAAEAAGPDAEAPQQGWGEMVKGLIWRFMIMYFIMNLFKGGSKTPAAPNATADGNNGQLATQSAIQAKNLFARGTMMDIYLYVSEHEKIKWGEKGEKSKEPPPGALLVWKLEDVEYGDWTSGVNGDGVFSSSVNIPITQHVQNNGSLYAHAFFVHAGNSPNPNDGDTYLRTGTTYKQVRINKYKKKRFVRKTANLITGNTEVDQTTVVESGQEMPTEIVSHLHPNLTLTIVDDHTPWVKGQVPVPLDEFIEFDKYSPSYYPIVFFNEYWNLNKDYWVLNDTVTEFNLTLSFNHLSMFKWQMYAAQSVKNKWMMGALSDAVGDESDEDQDALKEAMLDTNPYLLGATIIVTLLHSVFEFLAFKNDIQFWKSRDNLEGLSVQTVFWNVGQNVIVLLYVCDNDTNFMVKISLGIGLLIELWKITKVSDVSLNYENKFLGLVPRLVIADKKTYSESDTKKYDKLAFKYLAWFFFPLGAVYCVYSLIYNEHKGWYSFVLSVAYGFLLTFGFIMMTPQLFINYKMKSVAHLPWRMMTYKALNTFIDDIFAFIIKMPMMYRIGCFRDDIVFFIFLYQRWLYPVDPSRLNEFGTSEELLQKLKDDPQQQQSLQNGVEPAALANGEEPAALANGDVLHAQAATTTTTTTTTDTASETSMLSDKKND